MKDYSDMLNWSHEQILNEIRGIQYIYKLKETTRWGIPRVEEYKTETVAEHVYGMFTIAQYFLALEDPNQTMDHHKIFELIVWHDAGEIIHGDTPTYLKTDEIIQKGQDSLQEVFSKTPELIQEKFSSLVMEYENQETLEARFVKALDKIEPEFEVMNEVGKKKLIERMSYTRSNHDHVQDMIHSYVKPYPYILKFHKSIRRYREDNNYFIHE